MEQFSAHEHCMQDSSDQLQHNKHATGLTLAGNCCWPAALLVLLLLLRVRVRLAISVPQV
jgi:hypothetical protein